MTQFEPFKIYWASYGGLKALAQSAYLYAALILTGVCFPLWLNKGFSGDERPVAETLITIIPALMAFTLAGMAIILTLSGQRFLNAIRQDGQPDSLFMKVVALFFHFILIQTLALIAALCSASYPSQDWLAGFAFFMASYGITSAVAIAAMLLNVSRIFNVAKDEPS